jgi:Ca2+-binding RTX toxin-like protein
MKLTQLGSLYKLIRGESRTMRKSVAKQPRQRASAFVLESLENRVLLSATPMDVTTTEPVVTAAVVTTDKADYAPGETALITTANTDTEGLKFGEGELVQFQVTRTDGIEDAPMGDLPWYVTDGVGGFNAYQEFDANGQAIDRNADGMADWIRPDNDGTVNGSISTNWFVEDQYLGASLLLTATGQGSGAVATTEFTDGGGTLQFSSASYSVNEAVGTATITVNRVSASNGNVTVNYATSNGTATAGSDYTAASGTLTFGNGVTSQTFTVSITNDSVHESNETINLTLSSAGSGGNLGTPTTAVLTINDNDPATVTTNTTVSSNDDTSIYGDSVHFTAAVTGSPSVGTVQFYVDTVAFGSAVAVTGGAATSNSISNLTAGNHDVYAVYSGGAGYVGSTSANITQTVNKAEATISVSGFSGVYDGEEHGVVSSSATGVNNEALSGLVIASTTYTDVPGGQVHWTFSNTNYTNQSGDATVTITQANLTICIVDTAKTFGQTIDLAAVLGTTVIGVNGENLNITYCSTGTLEAAVPGGHAINGFVSNGTGMLSNYYVTIKPGTLTVTAPSVVTVVRAGANLIIVGTGGCDTITVNATNLNKITVNGTTVSNPTITFIGSDTDLVGGGGHVIVYGMACDDNISLTGNVNLEAHGGEGNDTITGGAGHDVIFGDTGNDTLTGAAGNDVLVGGSGSDRLVGSAGHDILISHEADDDYDYNDLRTISDNWASCWSADLDFGSASDDVLDESGSADMLTGSSGHDWFIVGIGDKITDSNSAIKDGDIKT